MSETVMDMIKTFFYVETWPSGWIEAAIVLGPVAAISIWYWCCELSDRRSRQGDQ